MMISVVSRHRLQQGTQVWSHCRALTAICRLLRTRTPDSNTHNGSSDSEPEEPDIDIAIDSDSSGLTETCHCSSSLNLAIARQKARSGFAVYARRIFWRDITSILPRLPYDVRHSPPPADTLGKGLIWQGSVGSLDPTSK